MKKSILTFLQKQFFQFHANDHLQYLYQDFTNIFFLGNLFIFIIVSYWLCSHQSYKFRYVGYLLIYNMITDYLTDRLNFIFFTIFITGIYAYYIVNYEAKQTEKEKTDLEKQLYIETIQ